MNTDDHVSTPARRIVGILVAAYISVAIWYYGAGGSPPTVTEAKQSMAFWGGPFTALLVPGPIRVPLFFMNTAMMIGTAVLAWKLRSKLYQIVVSYLLLWWFLGGLGGLIRGLSVV